MEKYIAKETIVSGVNPKVIYVEKGFELIILRRIDENTFYAQSVEQKIPFFIKSESIEISERKLRYKNKGEKRKKKDGQGELFEDL